MQSECLLFTLNGYKARQIFGKKQKFQHQGRAEKATISARDQLLKIPFGARPSLENKWEKVEHKL